MSPIYLTHGACGKRYVQRGERTSHCGTCHETFATLNAFERHRRNSTCLDPGTATRRDGTPAFTRDSDGHWTLPLTEAGRRRHETWLNQLRETRTAAERASEVPREGFGDSVASQAGRAEAS